MRKLLIPVIAYIGTLSSFIIGCAKNPSGSNNCPNDSLILQQNRSNMDRVDTIEENVPLVIEKNEKLIKEDYSSPAMTNKSDMVRVISSGGYDTLVYEQDVRDVQEEHHKRYGKGSFHSRSIKNGVSTHYACTHSSHTSHYSSYNPNWK